MMGRHFLLSIMVPAFLLYAVETRASSEVQKESNPYLAEISELREQVKMLMNRVNELEKRAQAPQPQPPQKQAAAPMMASNAPIAVPCPCQPVAQPCQSTPVCPPSPPVPLVVPQDGRQGVALVDLITHGKNNKLRVNITGQLNRAAWLASNGHKTTVQSVDNDSSSSRISLIAEGDLNKDLTVGGVYMMELLQNSTRFTDIQHATDEAATFRTRKAEVYAVSKSAGEFYLGHGYMASYESMQDTDLSSTKATMDGEKINEVANAVTFYDKTKHHISSGLSGTEKALTVGHVFNSCDGLGRQDRFRYNSPRFHGFSLQSSWAYNTNADMWDIALRYAKKWGKTQVAGTWDFARNNSVQLTNGTRTAFNQVNGSMGILFSNGISAMVAGAYRDWKYKHAPDASLWFTKLGYQEKYFCLGKTAFAVDYGQYRNFVIDTSHGIESVELKHKGHSAGVGVVQFFDAVNTELYLMGRYYKIRVPHSDTYEPVSVMLVGARVSF